MSESIFFSIIVPVYNIERYVKQCIDSILSQSFDDFELIIVDDGSSDGSAAICDGYTAADNRILTIHKVNGGLSSARNAGLDAARGDYLLFVDGDDFINAGSLGKIAEAIEADGRPDVMFLDAELCYSDGSTQRYVYSFSREHMYSKPARDVAATLARAQQFHVSACVKAVKRSFAERHDIRFTEGIVGEDVDYSIGLYLKAQTYSMTNTPYYCYRQNRAGSIMTQNTAKRCRDLLAIISSWAEHASNSADGELIYRFLYHQYFLLLTLYRDMGNSAEAAQVCRQARRFSFLLRHTDNKKAHILYVFYKLFGINMTSRAINLLGAN